jgi:hypothetical protein
MIEIVPYYAKIVFDDTNTKVVIFNALRHLAVTKSILLTSQLMTLVQIPVSDQFSMDNKETRKILQDITRINCILDWHLIPEDRNPEFFYLSKDDVQYFQQIGVYVHILNQEEYTEANKW